MTHSCMVYLYTVVEFLNRKPEYKGNACRMRMGHYRVKA